jgi:hypothetical protein
MENKGILESIAKKPTKTGKEFYEFKVAGLTFRSFDDAEAFKQIEAKEFKLGETVGYDYTETPGTYTDKSGATKSTTYRNIVKFVKAPQPTLADIAAGPKPTTNAPVDASIWEAKDRRIVRMASINAANELLRTNQIAMPEEARMISEISLFKLAKMIEDWVYRVDTQ